jgi:uncharacterized protein YjeT (DUF2065 family)
MDQAGCLEDTPLLPQRAKSGSIPGFALLSLLEGLLRRFAPRNARSAFHTVFSTPSLIHFMLGIYECFRVRISFIILS